MILILFISVLGLAYANGANDNFKGVATLWSSNILTYKKALTLATVATFAGAIVAYFFANALLKNFSGKGLVPPEVVTSTSFVLSVAIGAALTILLATYLGFPISTTHALVGGLTGAGLYSCGSQLKWAVLGKTFFLPLVLSPIIAVVISIVLYKIIHQQKIKNSKTLNALHIFSAGTVCFSHGLNDTPKIVSLILLCNYFTYTNNYFLIIAIVMAIGGIINAKNVARTMSYKITNLQPVQGLVANSITSVLSITASAMGLPVSFTHISVSAIYGVGVVTHTANNKEISKILLSWVLTLPTAFVISYCTNVLMR